MRPRQCIARNCFLASCSTILACMPISATAVDWSSLSRGVFLRILVHVGVAGIPATLSVVTTRDWSLRKRQVAVILKTATPHEVRYLAPLLLRPFHVHLVCIFIASRQTASSVATTRLSYSEWLVRYSWLSRASDK